MKYLGSRSASSSARRTAPFDPSAPGEYDDLRAEEAQQALAFLGRVLRHHARERIALELRDERERDARVAARRLEQLAAGLELARGLRRLDHRLRDAVLDRAGRVLRPRASRRRERRPTGCSSTSGVLPISSSSDCATTLRIAPPDVDRRAELAEQLVDAPGACRRRTRRRAPRRGARRARAPALQPREAQQVVARVPRAVLDHPLAPLAAERRSRDERQAGCGCVPCSSVAGSVLSRTIASASKSCGRLARLEQRRSRR